MRALFKDSDRLLIRDIKRDEKVLIDNFVSLFNDYEVKVTELMDIDNNLDGMTFTITNEYKNVIHHATIYTQMMYVNNTIDVVLGVDSRTNIDILNRNPEMLEISVTDDVVSITALPLEDQEVKIGHYIIHAILNKKGCEQTTVPIEIFVFYKSGSYRDLGDLPKINDVTVLDDKSLDDYGIQEKMDEVSNQDISDIIDDVF